jgi:hypothetical protein
MRFSRAQISFPDEVHPYACKSFAFSANLKIVKVKQSHPYEVLGRREQATLYIESILCLCVGIMAYLDKSSDLGVYIFQVHTVSSSNLAVYIIFCSASLPFSVPNSRNDHQKPVEIQRSLAIGIQRFTKSLVTASGPLESDGHQTR